MKNKEAYINKMVELLAEGGRPALKNGALVSCACIGSCDICDFCNDGCTDYKGANTAFTRWANEEYVPMEANWDLVPLDTPIYVWRESYDERRKAHFAGIGTDGLIYVWQNGRSSFTNPKGYRPDKWENAEPAEFHSEWMKRKEG